MYKEDIFFLSDQYSAHGAQKHRRGTLLSQKKLSVLKKIGKLTGGLRILVWKFSLTVPKTHQCSTKIAFPQQIVLWNEGWIGRKKKSESLRSKKSVLREKEKSLLLANFSF